MSRLSYCLVAIDTLWIGNEQMQLSKQRDPWAGTERPSQKTLQMTMLQLQFALFCLFLFLVRLNPGKGWNVLLYTVFTPPFQSVMNTHCQRGWVKLSHLQTEVAFSCRHILELTEAYPGGRSVVLLLLLGLFFPSPLSVLCLFWVCLGFLFCFCFFLSFGFFKK